MKLLIVTLRLAYLNSDMLSHLFILQNARPTYQQDTLEIKTTLCKMLKSTQINFSFSSEKQRFHKAKP